MYHGTVYLNNYGPGAFVKGTRLDEHDEIVAIDYFLTLENGKLLYCREGRFFVTHVNKIGKYLFSKNDMAIKDLSEIWETTPERVSEAFWENFPEGKRLLLSLNGPKRARGFSRRIKAENLYNAEGAHRNIRLVKWNPFVEKKRILEDKDAI